MKLKKYLVGLQFDTYWLQLGVYATDQMKAGDIAVHEFQIDRPPFCTSIVCVGKHTYEVNGETFTRIKGE